MYIIQYGNDKFVTEIIGDFEDFAVHNNAIAATTFASLKQVKSYTEGLSLKHGDHFKVKKVVEIILEDV